jgi:hypothetical protein
MRMSAKRLIISIVTAGAPIALGSAGAEQFAADKAAPVSQAVDKAQPAESEGRREAAATPNAQVNIASPPGFEQVNASVANSDVAPGEVYGVWTEYLTIGASSTFIGWSPSFLGGVPGSWIASPFCRPRSPNVQFPSH